MAINLTIASGQVPATAAEIVHGPSDAASRLNLTFSNVSTYNETLILTVSRNGATAVRICRVVLAPNEALEICGFPLNFTDSLLAVTTDALSVDYLVSIAPNDSPQTRSVYGDDGTVKVGGLSQMANALGWRG